MYASFQIIFRVEIRAAAWGLSTAEAGSRALSGLRYQEFFKKVVTAIFKNCQKIVRPPGDDS
ncbi:MAG: hypothetical protein DMG45_07740 [Acidobacteria bacterium]|nr:MAG: hypothetical protein AUH16_02295 [Acidobacteria bacterium 13_2_20CM_57_7]PYT43058.1 MAG: hypothetical protein DMG45_07740 [Acidobacteriota bacterium]